MDRHGPQPCPVHHRTGRLFAGRHLQPAHRQCFGRCLGHHARPESREELREAIAGAPAHGLKPELFLKGGESGAALVQAALKYASALANGYADPTKLHEVYTIPRPKADVRAGLAAGDPDRAMSPSG